MDATASKLVFVDTRCCAIRLLSPTATNIKAYGEGEAGTIGSVAWDMRSLWGSDGPLFVAYSDAAHIARLPRVSFAFAHCSLGFNVGRRWRLKPRHFNGDMTLDILSPPHFQLKRLKIKI